MANVGGRTYAPVMVAGLARDESGRPVVTSPGVGLWRDGPAPGDVVTPDSDVGLLEVLGVLHRIRAPAAGHGLVIGDRTAARLARQPVGFGDVLLVLDPQGRAAVTDERPDGPRRDTDGLVFRAPSSGRFYRRPAPDKPPFVEVGDTITAGQAVALLEVMKTFHRVQFDPEGLPDPGRITAIVAMDQADLEAGDPILELEPAP